MQDLPVNQVLPEIKDRLSEHNRLILQAPPGAGKTTLVPLALLQQKWLDDKKIIMLEPRRLATRNAAARMAELLGEKVGETVGYQIRQDRKFSKKTRILVVTEGILTRKLQADPELEGIGLIIFDEFHERNLHGDLSLAFCLQSQELLNNNLKILLMSATLNTTALAKLLSTAEHHAPVVSSQGRSFPVDVIFRQENSVPIDRWNLTHIICQQTLDALGQHEGNILIFLPGVREIKYVESELKNCLSDQFLINQKTPVIIAPLYGNLSKSQQDQAISPPPSGQRKIVLATNIAETSLTIEGINIVIDSGLQREARFNPGSGMNALHTTMITQDSATQRSGRAGRLSAGTSYRLWTESQQKRLSAHQSAEIMRADLAPMMLELAQWGIREVAELQWLDLPPPGNIAQARDLLLALQAIDETGKISTHGKNILRLGIHPRLAHMILTAQTLTVESENLVDMACLLAALISEKDFIKHNKNNTESRTSDIAYRLSILKQVRNKLNIENSEIDPWQCKQVIKSAREFYQRLNISVSYKNNFSANNLEVEVDMEMTGVLIALAYPDRIAKLRNNKDRRYLLSNGKGAYFSEQDPLAQEKYLAVANLHEQSQSLQNYLAQKNEARIFLAAAITQEQILAYFSDSIKEYQSISWNSKQEKVECLTKETLGKLTLNEKMVSVNDMKAIQSVLFSGIKSLGLNCLPWSKEASRLKQRVQFIQYQKKYNSASSTQLSNTVLPDFSDDYLLNNLEQWLLPHLNHESSIKQLQNLNLEVILKSALSWEQMQILDELAPDNIQVPSGSRIKIDYSEPEAPILAVRLQELFGLQQTPAILKGQLPLLLHLLSPASRPMQVTQDLASFWNNTYNDVKKELKGKYKKHYWPDDPLQAQATNRVKPRKS